jgi:transposase
VSRRSIAAYFPWRRVKVAYHNVVQTSRSALIRLEPDERFRPLCHACGQPARTVHSRTRKFVRDLSFGGYEMLLQVEHRKVWCDACGGVRVEKLEFVEVHERITIRLAGYAAELCRLGLSVQTVAEHLGLDPKTVKECDQAVLEKEFGQTRYDGLKRLAIDEIAVHKGHRYMTVVLDYDSGRVVWMGEGRQIDTLDAFFAAMPAEVRKGLQAVAIDMWEPYIQGVRKWCPQADIVFDLFHAVKAFNKVIDDIRNQEFHRADGEDRRALKGSKYLLLKNWKHLRRPQRVRLKEILALNRRLNTVYLLKDFLKHLWTYHRPGDVERELTVWCRIARQDGHPGLVRFAETLERHRYGIVNHARHALHTGRLEGVNNKIKVIKRVAYGFHDLRYFALKVKQAFPGRRESDN